MKENCVWLELIRNNMMGLEFKSQYANIMQNVKAVQKYEVNKDTKLCLHQLCECMRTMEHKDTHTWYSQLQWNNMMGYTCTTRSNEIRKHEQQYKNMNDNETVHTTNIKRNRIVYFSILMK